MWKFLAAIMVLCFLCEIEAGRNKALQTNKMVACEVDGVETECDGPFVCESRPVRARANRRQRNQDEADGEEDTPVKICVPPSCTTDADCALEGYNVSCQGRPNHKRCIYPRAVHVFFRSCMVKTTDANVVREHNCVGEDVECTGDRPLTYMDEEYLVSKCVPSEESDGRRDGRRQGQGKGRGRGRGGRRGGRRGEGSDSDSPNTMDEVAESDEQEGQEEERRGGRRRGGRRRTPKIQ